MVVGGDVSHSREDQSENLQEDSTSRGHQAGGIAESSQNTSSSVEAMAERMKTLFHLYSQYDRILTD